jgi:hypothetical protein
MILLTVLYLQGATVLCILSPSCQCARQGSDSSGHINCISTYQSSYPLADQSFRFIGLLCYYNIIPIVKY